MTTNRPQPLNSAATRFAAAFAVAGLVTAACFAAGHESHRAVDESSAAMSRGTIYVKLPTVEIVARREAASAVAASTVHRAAAAL
ncbi:hypothetical protein [Ramlibacter sp. PS4R-6]|uniref:hypothetical protein n=1 Tax=Ramlibacter sp. PS4R-6 TaxID=3133438 RepID=UPI0030B5CBEB